MRKIYLVFITMFFAVFAFAQNITVNVPYIELNPDDTTFDYGEIIISNNESSAYTLQVRQDNIDSPEGSGLAICFGIVCYPANDFDDYVYTDEIALGANSTYEEFKITYDANGSDANAVWQLVFFDVNTNNDVFTIDIFYDGPVGIAEILSQQSDISHPSPNPVESVSQIAYELPADFKEASFVVHNITGSLVKETILENRNGMIDINALDFEQGIYFYSLVVNGTPVHSKKLIISK